VKKWTADQVKHLLDTEVERLHRELTGFPEHYATRVDMDLLRSMIETIRADHVTRREMDETKGRIEDVRDSLVLRAEFDKSEDTLGGKIESIHDEQKEGQGRRNAFMVVLSVGMTLLALLFGAVWKSQLTHQEVSQQIGVESPWLQDRTGVEQKLASLDRDVTELTALLGQHKQNDQAVAARLSAIEKLDVFFCRTRTVKGLAPC
jgi:hypothetical protein